MYVIAVTSSILLVVIDQITKYVAVRYLKPIGFISLIDGVFGLTFVENRGAAFGLFQGGRWFFIVLTTAVLTGICVYYYKLPRTKIYSWVRFSLILILAGAVGNFIDRLRNGYVVDFFHALFIDFPVFNMADIYVVTGTILLSVLLLFFLDNEGTTLKGLKKEMPTIPEADENA